MAKIFNLLDSNLAIFGVTLTLHTSLVAGCVVMLAMVSD